MSKIIVTIVAVLLLVGCAAKSEIEGELAWLLHAEPEKDAELAIRKGDIRFIGVVGMFFSVPFFEETCVTNEKVRFIQISDLIESYEQRKLQAIAPIYAEAYNFRMLQHWKSLGKKQCDS